MRNDRETIKKKIDALIYYIQLRIPIFNPDRKTLVIFEALLKSQEEENQKLREEIRKLKHFSDELYTLLEKRISLND